MHVGFPFARTYEVEVLDRVRRDFSDQNVLAFPGCTQVDPQQEVAAAPIVRVEPRDAEPWIGIFYGSGLVGDPGRLPAELLSLPDGASFCVVYGGLGIRVSARDPQVNEAIPVEPVTGVCAVPEAGLVLFADFTTLTCYDRNGLAWRSTRLAWDDVRIESVDVERRIVSMRGFDAPANDVNAAFTVDLSTGVSTDRPYDWPDG